MRNFMKTLGRSSGVETGEPSAWSSADRQALANQPDRLLAGVRVSIRASRRHNAVGPGDENPREAHLFRLFLDDGNANE